MTAIDQSPGWKWDKTINVPTVLAILTALVTTIGWGIATYRDVDKKIDAGISERTTLRRDVDRLDSLTAEIRRDQLSQLQQLRSEVRSDLRDVNGKLDQLLMRGGSRP